MGFHLMHSSLERSGKVLQKEFASMLVDRTKESTYKNLYSNLLFE